MIHHRPPHSAGFDPEGRRLPIKLDATSNGEFAPIPLDPVNRQANRLADDWASANAKRRGLGRRDFLVSACGAASTLLAVNAANAAAGRNGGFYDLDRLAAVDPELARQRLEGKEFIFDVQGHFVGAGARNHPLGNAETFVKDVFLDSDTDIMVLSFIPARRDPELLTIAEADAARQVVERLDGDQRLMIHGRVNPNQDGDLQDMAELAERWKVAAFKTYTQWGPDGRGFFLDDEPGIRLIENARRIGVKNICVHKGLPFGQRSYEHSTSRDIGVVAKRYPDVNFLIYHSGFVPGAPEGPYDASRKDGVDGLIRSLEENGVAANANVYAELGSTWRYLMRDPDSAAHTLGKLLRRVGENNVLWGTDSIWYGSPQDQIQAFRVFQIAPALRDRYGYPELTPALRAKIFGLNATRPYGIDVDEVIKRATVDPIARERLAYRERPDPHYLTFGPRNRREFMAFRKVAGSEP